MGAVLAVCLAMVIGASFFAYKNLYFAGTTFFSTFSNKNYFNLGNIYFFKLCN